MADLLKILELVNTIFLLVWAGGFLFAMVYHRRNNVVANVIRFILAFAIAILFAIRVVLDEDLIAGSGLPFVIMWSAFPIVELFILTSKS